MQGVWETQQPARSRTGRFFQCRTTSPKPRIPWENIQQFQERTGRGKSFNKQWYKTFPQYFGTDIRFKFEHLFKPGCDRNNLGANSDLYGQFKVLWQHGWLVADGKVQPGSDPQLDCKLVPRDEELQEQLPANLNKKGKGKGCSEPASYTNRTVNSFRKAKKFHDQIRIVSVALVK